nr:hypothetical protein Itr_chr13CG09970 [Ipomoea trifida]
MEQSGGYQQGVMEQVDDLGGILSRSAKASRRNYGAGNANNQWGSNGVQQRQVQESLKTSMDDFMQTWMMESEKRQKVTVTRGE